MTRTRIGMLGCGSLGRRHLRNLRTLGYSNLLAFDPDPAARAAAHRESGAVCMATLDEVWAREPGVVVASPSGITQSGTLLPSNLAVY